MLTYSKMTIIAEEPMYRFFFKILARDSQCRVHMAQGLLRGGVQLTCDTVRWIKIGQDLCIAYWMEGKFAGVIKGEVSSVTAETLFEMDIKIETRMGLDPCCLKDFEGFVIPEELPEVS